MKFVFNDSLLTTVPSNPDGTSDLRFVPSGIILEKKIVISATINTVEELLEAYLKKGLSQVDRDALLDSADAVNILKDPKNLSTFIRKTTGKSGDGGSFSSNESAMDTVNKIMNEGAEQAGEPASRFAPFLSSKDQIIARLKPFMSESEIGNIFYQLEEKVKIPFTEVIGILEFCIQQSRSCNAKVKDLINFYIDHYGQKRQSANTKRIIETACSYQKLNPVVDIFSVLRDAVAGNQPKVGLGYLSKDPEAQLVFDNLIMLSQSSLPEQDEEIRRRFQQSRDALQNQEQKVNMQRAIYDMMKTEEMNLQLARMIKSLGSVFEFLLTQPMYRALKDMFYDLNAGKILMNQASSIFTGDTSPETRRLQQHEQQAENENVFTNIQESRKPFSDNQYNFLKLASPEVNRFIYAQNASQPTPEQKQEVSNILVQIGQAISQTAKNVVRTISEKLSGAAKDVQDGFKSIIDKIFGFFAALEKAIKGLLNRIANNSITLETIGEQFKDVFGFLQGGSAPRIANTINSNFIKFAQKTPQQGTTYAGGSQAKQAGLNALGIISQMAGFLTASIVIPRALSAAMLTNQWSEIINSIFPLVLLLMTNIRELFLQTNFVGKNAPVSSEFFDSKGRPTQQGLQMMANNKETMISLGISDDDAMALGKFRVQKVELMNQLRSKETILTQAESQTIQTGGGVRETTVADLPNDFQNKLKDFLDFTTKVEVQFKAALNIFRNAINNNLANYNDVQKTQANGLLAEFQKDLQEVQAKKSEWSSMKNIAGHMMRKRVLLQKLKPLQTQLDTMKKLGIPMSNVIASPNGILSQVGRIRSEEQQALNKLREEYEEKMQLLKNPDIIAPLTKYPTDTGVTKLPESPDQSDSKASPFDAPEDSQFIFKEENANAGAR
jgi:hypothetical protein